VSWGQNAWLASAGGWVGFLAWGASTQLNYSLVPWQCESGTIATPWISLALAIVTLGGGAVSLQSFRHRGQRLETQTPVAGTPFEMLATVSMGAAALFAIIIALQGSAPFLVPRCLP
jgi:hypothetical protein